MKHSANRAIRLLTQQVKALRGLHRIPNQPPRPKNPKAGETYDRFWSTQPSKATIRYWTSGPEFETDRS